MKITRLPGHTPNPEKTIVVVQERRRGCGCGIFALIALILGGIAIHSFTKKELAELDREEKFENARENPQGSTKPKAAPAAEDDWQIQSKRDEITDETTYYIALRGLRIQDGILEYHPTLIIRITPSAVNAGKLEYKSDVVVDINPEAINRNGVMADVRLDSDPAEKLRLEPSTTRRSFFLPDGFLSRIDGRETLVIRFETSLDAVRTLKFHLGGKKVSDIETTLVKRIRRDRPKSVKIIP